MRILVALLPLLAVAAAPPPSLSVKDVPALVKQLGSDLYAEREAATRALDRIGAPALRDLRKASWSADLEVRLRARRVVASIEGRIYGEVRVFDGEAGSVNGVAFSPDGKRAAAATSRGVRLWDVATGKMLAFNDGHRDRVVAVAFSPDGKLVASGSEDRTVRLWDAGKLSEVRVLRGHKGSVQAVAFSPEGDRLVSAGLDGLMQQWDVATGVPRCKGSWPKSRLWSLAMRPQGGRVLIGFQSENKVAAYDLGGERIDTSLTGHEKPVLSISQSRDGSLALTGSLDTTLRLWEMNSLHCRHVLKGHTAGVCAVAMSPDGKWAVSGGHDKVVRLWDLEEGRHVCEFKGHGQVIWSVAFSPDGKRALSGSHDGTMRLWAVGH